MMPDAHRYTLVDPEITIWAIALLDCCRAMDLVLFSFNEICTASKNCIPAPIRVLFYNLDAQSSPGRNRESKRFRSFLGTNCRFKGPDVLRRPTNRYTMSGIVARRVSGLSLHVPACVDWAIQAAASLKQACIHSEQVSCSRQLERLHSQTITLRIETPELGCCTARQCAVVGCHDLEHAAADRLRP
ncbi:hypothetical protein FGB62_48g112 [Gracilaria domingensis]|nr:hypothetical protein FGB62_48g112 [Gracilaria domingensis]